jgi:ABC-type transporter Mla subunit MlaD
MMKNLLFVLSIAGLFYSCGMEERDRLRAQVDSLHTELQTSQEAVYALQEVGVLIDSIDANRKILRTIMVEGTSYDDYVARMNDIKKYVKTTEAKMEELEKSLRSSKSTASSYALTIKKLRRDLEKTSKELVAMQEVVDKYRHEKDNLIQTVALKDAEIKEKLERIQIKEQELLAMETRIDEMMIQSRQDEAQAYFDRAQVYEELANRTKFAPRKKKETRKEALNLYRMSFFLGKEEAQPKIAELEQKI